MKTLLLSAVLILASLFAGNASAQCGCGAVGLPGRAVARALAAPVRLLRVAHPLQRIAALRPLRRIAALRPLRRVARGVRFAVGR